MTDNDMSAEELKAQINTGNSRLKDDPTPTEDDTDPQDAILDALVSHMTSDDKDRGRCSFWSPAVSATAQALSENPDLRDDVADGLADYWKNADAHNPTAEQTIRDDFSQSDLHKEAFWLFIHATHPDLYKTIRDAKSYSQ